MAVLAGGGTAPHWPAPPPSLPAPPGRPPCPLSLPPSPKAIEGGDEVVLRRKVVDAARNALCQLLKVGGDPVRRRLRPHGTPEVVAEVLLGSLEVVGELPRDNGRVQHGPVIAQSVG